MSLYQPISYLFEDNQLYKNEISEKINQPDEYAGPSQCLSIKKSIQLKEEYEKFNHFTYDKVILYRYDLLLWKPMLLKEYDVKQYIYVNKDIIMPIKSDLHFVMSSKNASVFSTLYDYLSKKNKYDHGIINTFLKQKGIVYKEDSICVHFDTNIIRRIHTSFMKKVKDVYGFTDKDISSSHTHVLLRIPISLDVVYILSLILYIIFIILCRLTLNNLSIYFYFISFFTIFIIYYLLLFKFDLMESFLYLCIIILSYIPARYFIK